MCYKYSVHNVILDFMGGSGGGVREHFLSDVDNVLVRVV